MILDPYRILGVSHHATVEEIHRAYRRLARQVHPDAGCSDAGEMAQVNAAWWTLGDAARRAAYDTRESANPDWPAVFEKPSENAGGASMARIRLMVVAASAVLVVVFMAVVLVGFGRVGVRPAP